MKEEACEITTQTQTCGNIKKCSKIQETFLIWFLKKCILTRSKPTILQDSVFINLEKKKKKLNCDNLVLQGLLTLTSREPTAEKVPSLAQSFQLPASCLCGRESLMSESPMPHSFGVSGCLHRTPQNCLPRDSQMLSIQQGLKRCRC